jgi:hypothetical protein
LVVAFARSRVFGADLDVDDEPPSVCPLPEKAAVAVDAPVECFATAA